MKNSCYFKTDQLKYDLIYVGKLFKKDKKSQCRIIGVPYDMEKREA